VLAAGRCRCATEHYSGDRRECQYEDEGRMLARYTDDVIVVSASVLPTTAGRVQCESAFGNRICLPGQQQVTRHLAVQV